MIPRFQVLLRGVPKTKSHENRKLLGIDEIAEEGEQATGGASVSIVELEYQPGKVATLIINDVSSQVNFNSIRLAHYLNAAGLILVYDPEQLETWDLLRANYEELAEQLHELPTLVIARSPSIHGKEAENLSMDDPLVRDFIDDNQCLLCVGHPDKGGIPDEIFAEFVTRIAATGRVLPTTSEEEEGGEVEEEIKPAAKAEILPEAEAKEEMIGEIAKGASPELEEQTRQEEQEEVVSWQAPSQKAIQAFEEPAEEVPTQVGGELTNGSVIAAKSPSATHPRAEWLAGPGTQTRWTCPKCGNNDPRKMREMEDRSTVLNVYPPIYGKKLKCGQCGAEWRKF